MMALPNSRFAEMLRRNLNRKSGSSNWDLGSPEAGAALSLAPFQAATDSIFSDQYNQVNFPISRFILNQCSHCSLLTEFLIIELTRFHCNSLMH